jgi:hypothetical protein
MEMDIPIGLLDLLSARRLLALLGRKDRLPGVGRKLGPKWLRKRATVGSGQWAAGQERRVLCIMTLPGMSGTTRMRGDRPYEHVHVRGAIGL